MKKTLAVLSALLVSSAYAQTSGGPSHMFEFNADSVLGGLVSLDKSKTRGKSADNDVQFDFDLNYAYSLPAMPQIQLGARVNYNKGTEGGRGDFEDYGLEVGAIYNFNPGMNTLDLMNATYLSLYLGMGWNNNYTSPRSKDEVRSATVALGRRVSLAPMGLNSVVWSPEIAMENLNSTTGGQLEYSQNIQFRVLQFSVFF
ncbi:MAG TPA: hypothetical protein VKY27_09105 [Bacteriovoracaceae bacterium]|nr:hypothetical protein [Bacteriovoracaceae bacterium]